MMYKFILLVILSSLQPGQLLEEQTTSGGENDGISGLAAAFDEIKALLTTIKNKTDEHRREFLSFRDQMAVDLMSLRDDLNSINDSVSNLSEHLQEHKQQAAYKLAELQTSLGSTDSKLDTLNATTFHLSTNLLLEIQTKISNAEQQTVDKLADTIQSYVELLPVHTCGGTGGWRRVVYLDMTDPNTTCPSGWQLTEHSKRTCGRATRGGTTCDSVTFPVSGGQYSRVCGRIKAYQQGATLAFYFYSPITSIDGAYITGLSLTHGDPREHIWTFAAGISEQQYQSGVSNCPCSINNFGSWNSRVPSFIGNDYFCESGLNGVWRSEAREYPLFPDDPLWDGENCPTGTCCSFSNPPFFSKTLDSSTSDDLELRLCNYHTSTYSDVPVELIELYVQ